MSEHNKSVCHIQLPVGVAGGRTGGGCHEKETKADQLVGNTTNTTKKSKQKEKYQKWKSKNKRTWNKRELTNQWATNEDNSINRNCC